MNRSKKGPGWPDDDMFQRPSLSGRLRAGRPVILEALFVFLFVGLPILLVVAGAMALIYYS